MNSSEEHVTYRSLEQPHTSLQVTNQSSKGDIGGSGNLDKVRELLFGNQVREFEKRFTRLEERLIKECANLRDETRRRLDSLEMYIQKEVETSTERIKTEQSERDEAVGGLAQELQSTAKSLEKKLSQLDEQTSQSQRVLRQQILEQSKSLNDEIRQKYEEILAVLEREAQELRTNKTNRSTLAALFAELAVRLNSER